MVLPELSREERAAAAARGVVSRQVRAQVRTGLGTGSVQLADVLRDGQRDDDRGRILARMRVVDLLSSFRGIGPVRAAHLMERIGIAANRRIGGLGSRQIDELIDAIAQRAARADPQADSRAEMRADPHAGGS